jgi:hypothetical protein
METFNNKDMKKGIFTTLIVALLTVAAFAQNRQSTDNNNYRKTQPKRTTAEQKLDSTGNVIDSSAQKATEDIREDAGQTRDQLQGDVNKPGNDVRDSMNNNRPQDSTTLQGQGELQKTTDDQLPPESKEDQKRPQDGTINQSGTQTDLNNQADASQQPTQNYQSIEVDDTKEGPDNQVVYKYQGGLYYVDRKANKMVKANPSDLRDSKSKVIIHEGAVTTKSKNKVKKSNKG